jgi:hypothetical protein
LGVGPGGCFDVPELFFQISQFLQYLPDAAGISLFLLFIGNREETINGSVRLQQLFFYVIFYGNRKVLFVLLSERRSHFFHII